MAIDNVGTGPPVSRDDEAQGSHTGRFFWLSGQALEHPGPKDRKGHKGATKYVRWALE
jgi:hypothetical protein